ncbi:hypothetical protein PGB90_000006 [Kerria lacca]
MATLIKKSTGLTGLKVVHNPEHSLRVVYGKILRAIQKIPPGAAYRKYTEDLVKSRLQVVMDNKTVEEIENKINCGQIEELIQQAEYELILVRKYISWKPWEPLSTQAPLNQWKWPPTE